MNPLFCQIRKILWDICEKISLFLFVFSVEKTPLKLYINTV